MPFDLGTSRNALDEHVSMLRALRNKAVETATLPVDAAAWALKKLGVPADKVAAPGWQEELGLTSPPEDTSGYRAGDITFDLAPGIPHLAGAGIMYGKTNKALTGINQMQEAAQAKYAAEALRDGATLNELHSNFNSIPNPSKVLGKGDSPFLAETNLPGQWDMERMMNMKEGDILRLPEIYRDKEAYRAAPSLQTTVVTHGGKAPNEQTLAAQSPGLIKFFDTHYASEPKIAKITGTHEVQHEVAQSTGENALSGYRAPSATFQDHANMRKWIKELRAKGDDPEVLRMLEQHYEDSLKDMASGGRSAVWKHDLGENFSDVAGLRDVALSPEKRLNISPAHELSILGEHGVSSRIPTAISVAGNDGSLAGFIRRLREGPGSFKP